MSKPADQTIPGWIKDHIELYIRDPDKGHLWDSTSVGGPGVLPTLLLSTTGRTTGTTRRAPLIYGRSGQSYVVIASKGGDPRHPAWYLNLKQHPECEIQVGHRYLKVRARDAGGEEREVLWNQLAKIYPPYNDYQAATSRRIPVVLLEPLTRSN